MAASSALSQRCWLPALALLTWVGGIAAAQQDRVVVIERTLETAPTYVTVHVQVWQGDRLLEGKGSQLAALRRLENLQDLDRILDGKAEEVRESSFTAFLDTGASGHVLSEATAKRFQIQMEPGAVYHETGLHGEVAMGVSQSYTLALAPTTGRLFDQPVQAHFGLAGRDVRFLINRVQPDPVVALTLGEINVIGMPAIRDLVVEIDPTPMGRVNGHRDEKVNQAIQDLKDIEGLENLDLLAQLDRVGVGPAVRLFDGRYQPPGVDLIVPLKRVDYTRQRNPADRGAKPTLSENFVVPGVAIQQGNASATGDWLLDTGAPASMISTRQAKAIGLLTAEGKLTRQPDFSLPLGGIGGQITPAPGFRIDVLRIKAADGRIIEYHNAHVLIKDVSTKQDSGETVTLDGVLGMNLLLPTVSGLGMGLPSDVADGPFQCIWIDGPRARLLLKR